MKHNINFAKKDVVVVLGCVVFLLISLGAVGESGRERAKRTVCLANLKRLTTAWNLYADDNEDRIVNGEAYWDPIGPPAAPVPTGGNHNREQWWVGNDCDQDCMFGGQRPQDIQIAAIRAGALYPYCKTEKLYHCSSGIRGEMRTYSIVDSMNGLPRSGTINPDGTGVRVGSTVLWVKKRGEIIVPGPAYRLVFIDEGRATPDSFAVHYNDPATQFWDAPGVRHGDGTNVSYADGHSDYWKWKGREVIANGRSANPLHQLVPTTAEGKEDLHRLQRAVWGRLCTDPIP